VERKGEVNKAICQYLKEHDDDYKLENLFNNSGVFVASEN